MNHLTKITDAIGIIYLVAYSLITFVTLLFYSDAPHVFSTTDLGAIAWAALFVAERKIKDAGWWD